MCWNKHFLLLSPSQARGDETGTEGRTDEQAELQQRQLPVPAEDEELRKFQAIVLPGQPPLPAGDSSSSHVPVRQRDYIPLFTFFTQTVTSSESLSAVSL